MSDFVDLMQCKDVYVRFGGVMALSGVSFNVPQGIVSALIGPNGAGKTTLLNVMTGMVIQTEGTITFKSQDISQAQTHERSAWGMVRTFQNLEIFSHMTVLENVMTGAHNLFSYSMLDAVFKTPRYFSQEKKCRDAAMEKLKFVGLEGDWNQNAEDLPYGKQRLLELARAICGKPDLLLLDEPAAGLNPKETRSLAEVIANVRSKLNITIVLVEHDMDLVMNVSDYITVLNFGQVIAQGTPGEIQNNPEVIKAYLGSED
ncbi:ABC transporter ATP-binding protein [Desulfonatronovibrio magnus]|uniref:ABC transporter ATP-binding protein n=1 Tax=Desulfonatronovibrio magnus TaxID=698827 RepID=UPI0005EB4A4C|nr:ABC transporter ATP-binding protein [Desulfonatronovibrio magnus]